MPRSRRDEVPPHDFVPHDRTRQAIADRVLESHRSKPTFYVSLDVDASAVLDARQALKAAAGEGQTVPTVNDYLLKAAALALREHRRFNSWYSDQGLLVFHDINVGFAVGTPVGVLLPTVFAADQKSLVEIAAETREMAQLARNNRLRASLQRNAGFTVSNLGGYGIERFTAIISPPQTAILSVGAAQPRPVVCQGEIAVRPMMDLTLTVDHRVHDGDQAAQFLLTMQQVLADPDWQ